jgi:hypothetical protein
LQQTPETTSAEKRRDEGDGGGVCIGERRLMEAANSRYGDGLNETP